MYVCVYMCMYMYVCVYVYTYTCMLSEHFWGQTHLGKATRHAGVNLPNDLIHNLSLGAPAQYHNSCIIGYFASGLALNSEVHK